MNGPVAIILAAGQGKRMKSEKAKVLHEVCGQPMIRYVVDAARGAGAKTIVVVVGYAADQVRDYLADEPDILFATQTEQLGTGHAAKVCRPLLDDYQGPALILVGDEPLLRPQPLADLLRAPASSTRPPACSAPPSCPIPTGFGRILRDSAGRFLRIVEERDCTPEERAITRGQPELLRLRAARPLGRPRPDRHQQRPGRILPDRRPRTAQGHGPQGPGAQRPRSPTTSSASTPASISPRRPPSCRRGSRTTG